ncbi:MAG TPA: response regulator [Chloroflexota bacterium]|nr:response regulator [Chloroflexota bacterium]
MIHLLLIDDEPRVARALEFAISGRDVQLETINAPVDIATQVAAIAPDAILLDLGLAEVNGLDVCRTLKQDRQLGEIPVLVLSGKTDGSTKAASFAAGADDFIAKPFVPTELIARVEAQLKRRRVK